MSQPATEVHVHIDPAFGEWIDRDVTPAMVKGKLLWITASITRVRRELAAAQKSALEAKYAYEDEFTRSLDQVTRLGAKSQTDAERTTGRVATVRTAKRARDEADLAVQNLKDELDELYRSQMPATQSLNRIVLAEYQAEWTAAGGSYQ